MKTLVNYVVAFSVLILFFHGFSGRAEAKANTFSYNRTFLDIWKDQQNSSKNTNLNQKVSIEKNSSNILIKNPYLGFDFSFTNKWNYDAHAAYNYVRLFNNDFRLDIYNDKLDSQKWINEKYIYGHTLDMISGYSLIKKKEYKIGSNKVVKATYNRPLLKNIKGDFNFYTYYFVERSNSITTFYLKTNLKNKNLYEKSAEELIYKMKFYNPSPLTYNDYKKSSTIYNKTLSLSTNKKAFSIPKGKVLAGAYTTSEKEFQKLNNDTAKKMSIRAIYKSVASPNDLEINRFSNEGQIPMIALLFEKAGSTDNKVMIDTIQGKYDQTLLKWAASLKQMKGTVLLRVGNEMNGNWSKWGPGNNYNDQDLYLMAYDRIYSILKYEKANNVKFVYNPNSQSSPKLGWNDIVMYYPGDNKTDFVGLTAYNYGSVTDSQQVNTFSNIYSSIYYENTSKFMNKPLIICEIGAIEEKKSPKSKFINDVFNLTPKYFPSIKGITWFDKDHEEYKLSLSSSTSAYSSFKNIRNNSAVIKIQ